MNSRKSLPLPQGVTEDDVRHQLQRILAAEIFERSQRLSDFLRYVVEKGLNGELDEIKETTLALEVFERPSDFEPGVDPIVRVEAGRLRNKVREYYETAGECDALWVGLAARGYRPEVRKRNVEAAPAAASSEPERPAPDRLSLAVLPVEDVSPDSSLKAMAVALTDQLIHSLAVDGAWEVAARTSIRRYREEPDDAREIAEQIQVSALLEGSLQAVHGVYRLQLRLVDARTGLATWAGTYEEPAEEPSDAQDLLARRTVEELHAHAETFEKP